MRIALYQPDIPQNAGTILRMGACLGIPVDVIGPAGFDLSDRAVRRAGLDYLREADWKIHPSFAAFEAWRRGRGMRLIVATTKAATAYTDVGFEAGDIVLMGRESAGVPDDVHEAAELRVRIPMRAGMRSLNVALAAAMILGEARRQVGSAPG